jgi:hypothetical protein
VKWESHEAHSHDFHEVPPHAAPSVA